MPVIFILDAQTLLNRVEFDKAAQDSSVAIYRFTGFGQAAHDRSEVFMTPHDFHIEVGMFPLMLSQEVFKVLVNSVQESVDFF